MSEQLAYTYRSLSAEADTRIIQLQPAPDASHPLHCFIAELCLSSENLIEYEALSYTWGQPDFTESLFVLQDDGRTSVLMITPNLRDALQRLRLRDRERRIWVDAVCIDQQDDSDKREQIPFMAQIYKNAWRVLVWLGRSLEGQRALIDIKKAMRFHSRDDEKIRTHTSNLVKSLQSLVQLSWFSRRWVIQEVVLAVDVVLMCGPEDLPFVRLDRIVTGLLRDNETLDTTSRTALEPLAAISKLWRTWVFDSDQDKGLRLFDLLQVFSNLECAIDHDKIFALCGLASDCTIVDTKLAGTTAQNIVITIDYNRPVEALFRSITKQMLGLRTIPTNVIKWGNMMSQPIFREITDAVMERCNGNYRKDLPPWAPDWCLPRRREALHKFFKHGDRWVTHGARAEWEKLVQHRLHMMAHGIDSEPDRKEDETYPGLHQMVQRNPLEL